MRESNSSTVVTVLGEGAFGTAMAQLLASNGYTVNLWCHDAKKAQTITLERENKKYLPGIPLHPNIKPTADLAHAISDAAWIFEAIPVAYLRSILEQARSCASFDQVWVVLSKGIEADTHLFPTQMIDDVLGAEMQKAVCAGPSFAREVARGAITGVTIAATDTDLASQLQNILTNSFFRPIMSTDLMGVQIAAALKNVFSLGMGILDGAGYSDNPKAYFLTNALAEMGAFAQAMGGDCSTIYGYAGIGDLVLTSMGASSKNLEVGRCIGTGEKLDQIVARTGIIAEGINTLKSVNILAQKYHIHAPISQAIYDVVFKEMPVKKILQLS